MGSGASTTASEQPLPPTPRTGSATEHPPSLHGHEDSEAAAVVGGMTLDCYPYTFSPLLLFAHGDYFDKGYSNYNSVAQFFSPALDVNMLENVLYDRKNMLYEDLLEHVTSHQMLVTCCIDAHFTAAQVLPNRALIYYDPLRSRLAYVTPGEEFKKLMSYLLLKCGYGDNQHIAENEDHYTGSSTNATRRMIYSVWRDIHKISGPDRLVRMIELPLNLDHWLLINDRNNPRHMSTQQTGNTCYFQTYLFAVLCKVCAPSLAPDQNSIALRNVDKLATVTVAMSRFLLEFFVEGGAKRMRPLTNSNLVLDFYRYEEAPYYNLIMIYLAHREVESPEYDLQFEQLQRYYHQNRGLLHKYSKVTLSGSMTSTLNSKSLQPVLGTENATYKLGTSHYYKYRAANLMFGFNTGIMHKLHGFATFNALRKNQLLAFYEQLHPIISECRIAATNKYRDYYFMPQFEVGQQELIDVHNWTYAIDVFAMLVGNKQPDRDLASRVHAVNQFLVEHIFFSTQRHANYEKFLSTKEFQSSRKFFDGFLNGFMSIEWLSEFAGLGARAPRRAVPFWRVLTSPPLPALAQTLAPQGSPRSTRRRKTSTR